MTTLGDYDMTTPADNDMAPPDGSEVAAGGISRLPICRGRAPRLTVAASYLHPHGLRRGLQGR